MFLHLLNEQEKPAFLSLAHHLITSDGLHIHTEEHEIISRMAAEMGIAPTVHGSVTFAEAAAAFQTQRAKDAALLELIGVAYADDQFSLEEDAFVKNLAEAFNITPKRVAEMDTWVRNVKDLTLQGANLLTA